MATPVKRRQLAIATSVMDPPLPAEFERFLRYMSRNERRAPTTIAARTVALRNYVRYCHTNGVDPMAATETDVLGWQASLTTSNATVANYSEAVRRV